MNITPEHDVKLQTKVNPKPILSRKSQPFLEYGHSRNVNFNSKPYGQISLAATLYVFWPLACVSVVLSRLFGPGV